MLCENIRIIRKSKGLSQEELAVRLNVVRQTVSKWEQGRSVPDADLLIALSEALETPVSALLGETAAAAPADDLRTISQKLETLNLLLARRSAARRRAAHWLCVLLGAATAAALAGLALLHSPYLGWDYSQPETAVLGVALHALEWLLVRLAPLLLAAAAAGAWLTRKKSG